jgi:hypothetical protein
MEKFASKWKKIRFTFFLHANCQIVSMTVCFAIANCLIKMQEYSASNPVKNKEEQSLETAKQVGQNMTLQ